MKLDGPTGFCQQSGTSYKPSGGLYGVNGCFLMSLQVLSVMRNQGKTAKVAELADAPDLGSGAARRESSSLSFRTMF